MAPPRLHRHRPDAPAELFIAAVDGSGERRLTDLNRACAARWRSAPERFRFERTGFTIDGWVMRPAGFDAGDAATRRC